MQDPLLLVPVEDVPGRCVVQADLAEMPLDAGRRPELGSRRGAGEGGGYVDRGELEAADLLVRFEFLDLAFAVRQ